MGVRYVFMGITAFGYSFRGAFERIYIDSIFPLCDIRVAALVYVGICLWNIGLSHRFFFVERHFEYQVGVLVVDG